MRSGVFLGGLFFFVTVLAGCSSGFEKFSSGQPAELTGKEVKQGGQCRVDSVNGAGWDAAPVHQAGQDLILDGWAFHVDKAEPAASVYVQLVGVADGAVFSAHAERYARPDVAGHFQSPLVANSGFKSSNSLDTVPPGVYLVQIAALVDARVVACTTQVRVQVAR